VLAVIPARGGAKDVPGEKVARFGGVPLVARAIRAARATRRACLAEDGTERVAGHRGDGMGVAAMCRAGLSVLVASTEVTAVAAPAAKLGVECCQGIGREGERLASCLIERHLPSRRVLFLGNDVNDPPRFRQVGWPVVVASAQPPVRAAARATTTVPGGHGAVREIASWIIEEDQL
jgi:3-deoxy-D-manno-octulosonate 8-phosphate phosphatase KdsC-like HAD superfamily phosphatase